jgi:hypothetical protein
MESPMKDLKTKLPRLEMDRKLTTKYKLKFHYKQERKITENCYNPKVKRIKKMKIQFMHRY